jgi:hypothetical protein
VFADLDALLLSLLRLHVVGCQATKNFSKYACDDAVPLDRTRWLAALRDHRHRLAGVRRDPRLGHGGTGAPRGSGLSEPGTMGPLPRSPVQWEGQRYPELLRPNNPGTVLTALPPVWLPLDGKNERARWFSRRGLRQMGTPSAGPRDAHRL